MRMKLRVARAVARGVQDGVDVPENFFGGVVVLVPRVDEGAEFGSEIFVPNVLITEAPLWEYLIRFP
jgi:hypothetical protein